MNKQAVLRAIDEAVKASEARILAECKLMMAVKEQPTPKTLLEEILDHLPVAFQEGQIGPDNPGTIQGMADLLKRSYAPVADGLQSLYEKGAADRRPIELKVPVKGGKTLRTKPSWFYWKVEA